MHLRCAFIIFQTPERSPLPLDTSSSSLPMFVSILFDHSESLLIKTTGLIGQVFTHELI